MKLATNSKLSTAALALALAAATVTAATVTDVSSRQRWPWNNLVDVDFTINGNAGEPYAIALSATCNGGATTLTAKTFASEPVAAADAASRVVWDLGADYPDLKAYDFIVTVTATPLKDTTPVYMVVDLSNGADATSYPVRYTTTAPTTVPGELNPCKTTEMWFRRIKAGTIGMGGGNNDNSTYGGYPAYTLTLTNDYYLAIFPITFAQCMNIHAGSGDRLHFNNPEYSATRPMDSLKLTFLRDGSYLYPHDPEVKNPSSILGRLRARTGLDFDLPTEWQWEYAMRAGKSGGNVRNPDIRIPQRLGSGTERNWSADYGTCYVDYGNKPNEWGLYLIYGNVWEYCINRGENITAGGSYTEPLGNPPNQDGSSVARVARGVGWTWGYVNYDYLVNVTSRRGFNGTNTGAELSGTGGYKDAQGIGARLCLTIKK